MKYMFFSSTLTPWPESESELYRPSDRRFSAKTVPTFMDIGCRMVSAADPYGPEATTFSFK
jgi:hypothetical protein